MSLSEERDEYTDEDRSESSERWLVSYADFVTLLFAFFTVLYATSERNAEKTEKFEESVKKYLIKSVGISGGTDRINQSEKYNSPIEPPIPTYQRNSEEASANLQKDLEALVESKLVAEERSGAILDISTEELGVRMSLAGSYFFQGNSNHFRQQALPALQKIGAFLAQQKRRLMVEGHLAGGKEAWDVAALRASAFVRYLIQVQHYEPSLLVSSSRGNSRPLVDNSASDLQKNKNSRLDIIFLNDDLLY